MDLRNVSLDDGRACAVLINLLQSGRWDLSGKDAEELVKAKRWLQALATVMAEQLRTPAPAPAEAPMRIKAMGPIGTTKKSKARK